MSKVNILTFADGNYIQHACILLMSLKDVVSSEREYHVFLFHANCSHDEVAKVKKTLDGYLPTNITYELRECHFDLQEKMEAKLEYMTSSIYDKILLYDHLPPDLEKIVFLDADIVLFKDPAQLHDLDVSDHVVAAVVDQVFEYFPTEAQRTLGIEKADYFNSGVMLVNLAKWKSLEISRKSLKFCTEKWDATPLHDQDGMNYAVKGQWLKISPLWNPRIRNEVTDAEGRTESLTRKQVYERNLSHLVHYSGPEKPWFYMSFHPKKQVYLDYLKQSEFRTYRFPDHSPWNVFRKQIIKYRRRIYFFRKRLWAGILDWQKKSSLFPETEEGIA